MYLIKTAFLAAILGLLATVSSAKSLRTAERLLADETSYNDEAELLIDFLRRNALNAMSDGTCKTSTGTYDKKTNQRRYERMDCEDGDDKVYFYREYDVDTKAPFMRMSICHGDEKCRLFKTYQVRQSRRVDPLGASVLPGWKL